MTEAQLLAIVARAAQEDWRAATYLLNRLYPVGKGPAEERQPPQAPVDDPFREVDELAARRA
jgi:transposase